MLALLALLASWDYFNKYLHTMNDASFFSHEFMNNVMWPLLIKSCWHDSPELWSLWDFCFTLLLSLLPSNLENNSLLLKLLIDIMLWKKWGQIPWLRSFQRLLAFNKEWWCERWSYVLMHCILKTAFLLIHVTKKNFNPFIPMIRCHQQFSIFVK